jgi:DivIVA domain-containing protein
MRLPDGAKSRALLIGTAAYDHLDGVPAARNNVDGMRDFLLRRTGLHGSNCTTLTDPRDLSAVGRAVEDAAREAQDLLLVYYSGHGLVDSDGLLHLALPQTSQELLPWSGIPFAFLHKAIQTAPASTKVIILDSCFSGIATEVLTGGEAGILGQLRISGHFTLTSSPANSPSYAFEGRHFTAFTELLLGVFREGIADAGDLLTLNDVYRELLRRARELDLPQPQKCGTHTADMLALAANPHRGGPAVPAAHAGPRDTYARDTLPRDIVADDLTDEDFAALAPPAEALVSVEEVRDIRFKTVRLTEGYDEDEVDAFLDRVLVALVEPVEGPQRLSPDDVRNSLFATTRLREGYDMEDVDAFLDRVEAEFERRQAIAAQRAR